jgi:hypothetical protein
MKRGNYKGDEVGEDSLTNGIGIAFHCVPMRYEGVFKGVFDGKERSVRNVRRPRKKKGKKNLNQPSPNNDQRHFHVISHTTAYHHTSTYLIINRSFNSYSFFSLPVSSTVDGETERERKHRTI